MKRNLTLVFSFFIVFSTTCLAQTEKLSTAAAGLEQGAWYNKAIHYLKVSSLEIQQKNGVFRANNMKNGIVASIEPGGYKISSLSKKPGSPSYLTQFRLKDPGMLNEQPILQNNKLIYQHEKYTVEYINDTNGLRQNFIVPAHAGDNPLAVELEIESPVKPLVAQGNVLIFPYNGNAQLVYDDLKVWDATHRSLDAHFEYDSRSSILKIVVDDKNATYPVTIDPLNRIPEWTTTADDLLGSLTGSLAVEALYGYTVAGLGDVNNDGFDDVAISAPAMADIITGSGTLAGVGAVFVYFGSANGLSTIPDKVLQPNTAVAGALFGFSVAGGDVTGDGINDIVVGAPLDQVNVSGLDVKLGKVYVYQGGALTGQNPAHLLALSLSGSDLFGLSLTLQPLYGFSVAVADDMNADGKGEILVGAPTYTRLDGIRLVKTGGAFLHLSDLSNSFSTKRSLEPPTGAVLGLYEPIRAILQPVVGPILWPVVNALISPLLNGQVEGLLFGFSVDGAGPYNSNGTNDVVVGAPAGVSVSSILSSVLQINLLNLLSGQFVGGSAYVFDGTANATGVNTASIAGLQASSTGLLSNAANLFGYTVRGVTNTSAIRNGNILAGAPAGAVLSNVLGGLEVKAGQLHVFHKNNGISNPVSSNQVISSPRSSSILSILSGQTINLSLLYASSIDNMLDVNCDGINDIIVGEPLSTAVPLIGADIVGGAAYVYLGTSNGNYIATPYWDLFTEVSPLLGINATALLGYSVAGARHVKGPSQGVRALVGGPANALDFSTGLLNLGNTIGTLLNFVADDNGLGKAYGFPFIQCIDSDGDGIPDSLDVDDDNDGIPDRYEFARSQNGYGAPATDPGADDDLDGIPNYMDSDNGFCGGLNTAGICSAYDMDGDGVPNHLDLDSDNDGLQDVVEAGGVDANGDGRVDCLLANCDGDLDGLLATIDLNDASLDQYGTVDSRLSNGLVPGTTSGRILDTDGDGVPDFLDIDSDNDGITDVVETGGVDSDGDGRVDFTGGVALIISTDNNADGIADAWSDGYDPDRFLVDFDNDSRPNYRDLDSDADGIDDVLEAGGADPDGNGLIGTGSPVVNSDGYASTDLPLPLIVTDGDTNNDGRPDDSNSDPDQSPYANGGGTIIANFRPDQDGDTRPNFLDLDSDNDGLNDMEEGTVNTDGPSDDVPDYLDLDSDNDGIFDVKESGHGTLDVDGDGIVNCNTSEPFVNCDNDLDGILSAVDGAPAVVGDAPEAGYVLPDTDADGQPDHLDLDSDNDAITDLDEWAAIKWDLDSDNDGRVDGTDSDFDGIINIWQIDNNQFFAGTDPIIALPLTLLDFTGKLRNGMVELEWKTTNEVDVSHFEVERSEDGHNFHKLLTQNANGGEVIANYRATDQHPSSGRTYYRLKMVDLNGSWKNSKTIMVQAGQQQVEARIIPNPVVHRYRVEMNGLAAGRYQIIISDLRGNTIWRRDLQWSQAQRYLDLEKPENAGTGIYIIRISNNKGELVSTGKLFITR